MDETVRKSYKRINIRKIYESKKYNNKIYNGRIENGKKYYGTTDRHIACDVVVYIQIKIKKNQILPLRSGFFNYF